MTADGSVRHPRHVEIIGHRGVCGPDGPPENTLDAIETAFASGADGVEIDVRITADAVPVCVHDRDLRRLTGRPVAVSRLTYREIRALPLRLDHRIAAAEDVLALARGRGRIVLDVKHDSGSPGLLVDRTLDAVRRTRTGKDVTFSSFSPAALAAAAAHRPDLPRALITMAPPDLDAAAKAALGHGCAALHPQLDAILADPDAVARWREQGLSLRPWTVNDRAEALDAAALGSDAVITDQPGAMRAALLAPAGPAPAR